MALEDPIRAAFLETVAAEATTVNEASDVVTVAPRPASGMPPSIYDGVFRDVEHFERSQDGSVVLSAGPVQFSLSFVSDYLRSADPGLQFRVARVWSPLVHPNASAAGLVCLGGGFRPGTGLRALVDHLYLMISGRVFATDHAFDADAQRYFLSHLDAVKALRAKPLWRRSLARAARVEQLRPAVDAADHKGA